MSYSRMVFLWGDSKSFHCRYTKSDWTLFLLLALPKKEKITRFNRSAYERKMLISFADHRDPREGKSNLIAFLIQ